MSWIDDFMEATKEAESPREYFYWSALATISATVRNKVWLDKFYYKLYPSIYVMLIGDSGLRKSFPVNLAKRLVQKLEVTRVISGRNSIQAIIQELGRAQTAPGKKPIKDAIGAIFAEEVGTLLIDDPQATNILMDLHDGHYHDEMGWKNTLKSSGVDELKNVNLTLLGAANPTVLRDIVRVKETTSGFVARTMMVVETRRAKKNSLVTRPEKVVEDELLLPYLRTLVDLEGPFVWEPSAAKRFDEWYMNHDPESAGDKTGTSQRIHDQILKVAMLMSLADRPSLKLELQYIEAAIDKCLKFKASAQRVTQGQGTSEFGPKFRIVIDELLVKKEITRSVLLTNHYGDFDAQDLDRIIVTLVQAKCVAERIVRKKGSEGQDVIYTATPALFNAFEQMKKVG